MSDTDITPDPDEATDTPEVTTDDDTSATQEAAQTEPETFPRSYVEELRQENGKYRQRAQKADDLAHRLHTALVERTGRLADPTDLPFDDAHLDDADSLTAAIDELLEHKPHLATRKVSGDIGQGASSTRTVDLAAIMRGQR